MRDYFAALVMAMVSNKSGIEEIANEVQQSFSDFVGWPDTTI